MQIRIKDHLAEVQVPVSVVRENDRVLHIDSRFQLSHTQLNLSPFSALGGAITVGEQMDFSLTMTLSRR